MSGAVLRLFVAVYPPESAAREMLRALRKLSPPLPAHRETRLDQVHMTLSFIGDTPVGQLDQVLESAARSVAGLGSYELSPERLITLPERGRPRLVALETDAPGALIEIQSRLARRLARLARARPHDRFRPHMTLCRFTRGAASRDIRHPVAIEPFRVEHIVVMKSVLRSEGAEHTEVGRFILGGGGAVDSGAGR